MCYQFDPPALDTQSFCWKLSSSAPCCCQLLSTAAVSFPLYLIDMLTATCHAGLSRRSHVCRQAISAYRIQLPFLATSLQCLHTSVSRHNCCDALYCCPWLCSWRLPLPRFFALRSLLGSVQQLCVLTLGLTVCGYTVCY